MGVPPYALSVSHFVSSVGADAGFAAIVGLAILILLYFAQARETASLRDRFGEAAEQVRQLEARVAHLSRSGTPAQVPAGARVAPRPAAAAAPVAARSAARVPLPVSQVPMAPAGVGAPALSAATRFIPSGDEGAIAVRAGGVRVGAAAGAGAGAALVAAEGASEASRAGGGAGVLAPPAPPVSPPTPRVPGPPAPATAAGATAATGAGVDTVRSAGVVATPAPANGGTGAGAGTRTPPPAAAPAGPGQDPARASRVADPRRPSTGQPPRRPLLESSSSAGGSGPRWALMIVAGLLLIGAIVAALILLTSSGGGTASVHSSSAISEAPSRRGRHRAAGAGVRPATVTVAVLNGTATSNLAHDVSLRLTRAGYKPGTIATATDQTQTATTVGYLPGQRRAAQIVARSLNLGPTALQPVTQTNEAVACPQPAACTAQVVVTVGSDLASAASSPQSSSPAPPGTSVPSGTTP